MSSNFNINFDPSEDDFFHIEKSKLREGIEKFVDEWFDENYELLKPSLDYLKDK